ncbi:MAG: translation initiation factor [Armatimonadota bacterium]
MDFRNLLGGVLDMLTGGQTQRQRRPNVRPAAEDPWGDPADQGYAPTGTYQGRNVRPASEDPYGDPADEFQGQQVRPASMDPYGDPADQFQGHQVLDSSQDPYGDPADEERYQPQGPRRRRY